jgi:hypothetical protein
VATAGDWSGGLTGEEAVSWHGLRGVDLAGLASILSTGLQPAETLSPDGWRRAVCVSGAPEISLANGCEANSFLNYTMNEASLALALDAPGVYSPNGGYQDEHHVRGVVAAGKVRAVVANDVLLDTPLDEVDAVFEPMKPDQARAYIDRNLALAARLAGRAGRDPLSPPGLRGFAARSERLSHAENSRMHAALMQAYTHALDTPGRPAATVGDAVRAVVADAPVQPGTLTWTSEDKRELRSRSVQVAVRQSARVGGSRYDRTAPLGLRSEYRMGADLLKKAAARPSQRESPPMARIAARVFGRRGADGARTPRR